MAEQLHRKQSGSRHPNSYAWWLFSTLCLWILFIIRLGRVQGWFFVGCVLTAASQLQPWLFSEEPEEPWSVLIRLHLQHPLVNIPRWRVAGKQQDLAVHQPFPSIHLKLETMFVATLPHLYPGRNSQNYSLSSAQGCCHQHDEGHRDCHMKSEQWTV